MLKQSECTELLEKLGLENTENAMKELVGSNKYSFVRDSEVLIMCSKLVGKFMSMNNRLFDRVNCIISYNDGRYGLVYHDHQDIIMVPERVEEDFIQKHVNVWQDDEKYILLVETRPGTFEFVVKE